MTGNLCEFLGEELDNETRICSDCLCEKHISEFGMDTSYVSSKCKTCKNKHTTQIKKLKKFHPYPEENYACPICHITQIDMINKGYTTRRLTWCLDHDHETGKFRGYICNLCNTGISNLQENIQILVSAIKYLK